MRLLYKPFGLIAGLLASLIARRLFAALWGRVDDADPPKPDTREATWSRVVGAAALEATVFAVTRAIVDRAGVKTFNHFFGIWPGKEQVEHND